MLRIEKPAGGRDKIRGFAPEKRRAFHQRQLNRLVPRFVVPFPPGRWPWKGDDVTQDTHDVIQCLWRFWEAVVAVMARVAASGGPRGPNFLLQELNVALEGANVTLKGHDVFIYA
jgi:hypothetical protein